MIEKTIAENKSAFLNSMYKVKQVIEWTWEFNKEPLIKIERKRTPKMRKQKIITIPMSAIKLA